MGTAGRRKYFNGNSINASEKDANYRGVED